MQEASAWADDQKVNWSDVGSRYGLTQAKRGQLIKEYLAEQSISTAMHEERSTRVPRRAKTKLPGGDISYPSPACTNVQKQIVKEKIAKGDIEVGKEIVKTSYTSYKTNKENEIEKTVKEISARKIPLKQIRQRLLEKHKQKGLIRDYSNDYLESLSDKEVKQKLQKLHEYHCTRSSEEHLARLKEVTRTRNFKIWHDHSEISGHSHFLVLVSVVYDPAFFYTNGELKSKGLNIDIQTFVEEPQVHILARSSSSVEDQQMFSECRRECTDQLQETLKTSRGTVITDVIRIFHGDGPAQRFEAGNKIGGNYACVGCDAKASTFDDPVLTHHANHPTLSDRQNFILQGILWKSKPLNPFHGLKVAELRSELSACGIDTKGKKCPEMEKQLTELQKGNANFPALLQPSPQTPFESINLNRHEVFPTEPLHDLKGHFGFLTSESIAIAKGKTKEILQEVHKAVLKKILRCSDYRKAIILMYTKLSKCPTANPHFSELFRTASEISHLMYCHDNHRTPKNILRLHNNALHAVLCSELFPNNAHLQSRYYHSINVSCTPAF